MRPMESQDYTTSFTVDRSPEEAFAAINNVRGWWEGEIEGWTDRVGSVFTYQYGELHKSRQRVTELVTGKRVVWLVTEGGPRFVNDKNEWTGTVVIFDITRKGGRTQVRFAHKGLIPKLECYDSCTDAWGSIIRDSLLNLIATGKGLGK